MSELLEAVALEPTDAQALSELYRETPDAEWCDLSPDVEVTPDGGEGFAGVRIT